VSEIRGINIRSCKATIRIPIATFNGRRELDIENNEESGNQEVCMFFGVSHFLCCCGYKLFRISDYRYI
jgi:hypothetical protein